MTRVGTALRAGAREYRRTPVLLALLAAGPAYAIGVFSYVAPDVPARIHVDGETVRVSLTEAFPAFTTPMVAALVTGIAGLYLLRTAAVDRRLVLAGYRPVEVVLARVGLLAGVGAVATLAATAVMALSVRPEQPGWFLLAVGLAALTYGLVGALAGLVVDRLAGVYLVLFGSLVDLFLFQNPLATDPPDVAPLLPGHYPMALAVDAAFTAGIDGGVAARSVAVLALLTGLVVLAVYRETR